MERRRGTCPSQSWRIFISNHSPRDGCLRLLHAPTATFKVLNCFVVLSLDRRRILHVDVTSNPTAAWTARQLLEAFPGDLPVPRFLMRDRDGAYGWEVQKVIRSLGVKQILSAPRSPWQNPFVERVIGTIRRDCTDHVIAMGERHLLGVLSEYVGYYNDSRAHQSLEGNAPVPRRVEAVGQLVAEPVLGGLHHRYSRAA